MDLFPKQWLSDILRRDSRSGVCQCSGSAIRTASELRFLGQGYVYVTRSNWRERFHVNGHVGPQNEGRLEWGSRPAYER